MIWHRPNLRIPCSWLSASTAFWYVSVASPAASCSFVDPEAAIVAAIAEARFYWMAAALLVAAIFVLDVLEKRIAVDAVLGALVVVLHPAWTIPPFFHADCTFENVNVSQWASILLASALALRVLRFYRRPKVSTAIAPSQ